MNRDTYGVNPLAPDAPPRPTPRDPAPPPVSYEGDPLTYDGEAGTLFGMGLKIALLTVLTFGIYRFWGKTNVRRYLWSRLRLFGDRFEYTGTGKELFLGFLIALLVLIPLGALSYASSLLLVGSSSLTQGAVTAVQYVVLLFLLGYAAFRARRYRLSRTMLRGIRFWQTGSNVGYALRWMGYLLLTAITAGIARPVGDAALYRYTMRHTWFGSQPFDFAGRAGPMMGRWLLCLLLMPVTLGLSLLWFAAFQMRYLVGQTRYQGLVLSLPVTFGNLFRLYLPYVLVMILLLIVAYGAVIAVMLPTMVQGGPIDPQALQQNIEALSVYGTIAVVFLLGLIGPVLGLVLVTHRMLRLVTERLKIEGDIDLDAVMQNAARRPKAGEGLADALDVGGGLEIGL